MHVFRISLSPSETKVELDLRLRSARPKAFVAVLVLPSWRRRFIFLDSFYRAREGNILFLPDSDKKRLDS